jgi:hypothetical protein
MKQKPQMEFVKTALKDIVCYNCREAGHISRNCPENEKSKNDKHKNKKLN